MSNRRPERWLPCIALMMATVISGCSLGLIPTPEQVPEHFVLGDPVISTVVANPNPKVGTLLLSPVTASPSLASDRILISRDALTRGQYQFAFWVDPLPQQFDKLIQERFAARRPTTLLTRLSNGTLPDYVLQLEIFDAFHDIPSGQVVLTIGAEVSDQQNHRLIASTRFTVRSPVTSPDAVHAVEAFHAAAGRILDQIGEWLESSIKE